MSGPPGSLLLHDPQHGGCRLVPGHAGVGESADGADDSDYWVGRSQQEAEADPGFDRVPLLVGGATCDYATRLGGEDLGRSDCRRFGPSGGRNQGHRAARAPAKLPRCFIRIGPLT